MTAPTPSPPSAESSPPSSTSPPVRYFDLLPPELLRHILRQIDSLAYRDREIRQATLYSLCLTSKILYEIAQPLLLKRIYIVHGNTKKAISLPALLAENTIESLIEIRTLYLSIYHANSDFFGKEFRELVRKASRLQEVFIDGSSRAVQILGGTNIATLSLRNVNLERIAGPISFPRLVNLSLYSCQRLEVSQFFVPELKHLVLIPSLLQNGSFSPGEVLFLDRVAPTIASLTIKLDSSSSLPPSVFSSTISLLLRTNSYGLVPPGLSLSSSVLITHLNNTHVVTRPSGAERRSKRLEEWTNLVSTSDHQLEALYLAIYTERGGGGGTLNLAVKDAVNGLVAACQVQGISVFWEETTHPRQAFADGTTFAELVPASFIRRSEARYAEAHRL